MAIVLFDSECGLCRASIGWASRHLDGYEVSFVPRESPAGQKLSGTLGSIKALDSVIFLDGAVAYARSDAVLAILSRCRLPWRLVSGLKIIPRAWRDRAYDLVARVRRIPPIGKRSCRVVPG